MNLKSEFYQTRNDEVYLDSAATTKRLKSVVQKSNQYYENFNANVHRGNYLSAKQATFEYEQSRTDVKGLINAKKTEEIVFTSGATESLNIIANGVSTELISGDHILVLESEHHANFLPWFALAKRLSLTIIPIKLGQGGTFGEQELEKALKSISHATALVICAHVSNAIGNIYPVKQICEKAKKENALTVIDGTQAIAHFNVDVQEIDCDFYVFSGHKMYATTGIGILYGKYTLLDALLASKLGGEMITMVSWESFSVQPPPLKFEGGTSNISGAIGLASSVAFLKSNLNNLQRYELQLFEYLAEGIKPLYDQGLLIVYGNVRKYFEQNLPINDCACAPILSFNIMDIHCFDVASYLSQHSLAVRAGHHCAMPLMQALNIDGCVRVSLACYNHKAELDLLILAIQSLIQMQHADSRTGEALTLNEKSESQKSLNQILSESQSHKSEFKTSRLLRQFEHTHLAILTAKEWSEKHRQLLLLSKHLPVLSEEERLGKYEINGCEARVWLKIVRSVESPQRFCIEGYSNSKLVRGLLTIMIAKSYLEPTGDLNAYLEDIGLSPYFSQGRRDGINKIIQVLTHHFNT